MLKDELTSRIKVVHCYEEESAIPAALADNLRTIDHLYPTRSNRCSPGASAVFAGVDRTTSRRFLVPENYMFIGFIGTPGNRFPHALPALGGVRLICNTLLIVRFWNIDVPQGR